MNYNQAFPKIYRKLKENGITMDSLALIQILKVFEAKVGNIQEKHIQSIVNQLVNNK